jgi:hypothetical protein
MSLANVEERCTILHLLLLRPSERKRIALMVVILEARVTIANKELQRLRELSKGCHHKEKSNSN